MSPQELTIYFKLEVPPTMSAKVTLDNIRICNPQSLFTDGINFEVTFSTACALQSPISWRVIYVGSAIDDNHDQILQQFEIDPIDSACTSKFEISCSPPRSQRIPRNQLLCVTALILTASYRNQQFIRVGYYVHNQLIDEFPYQQSLLMPLQHLVAKIRRTIICDKPRITKFNIQWEPVGQEKKGRPQVRLSNRGNLEYYFSKMSSRGSEQDSDSIKNRLIGSERQTSESGSISMKVQ